MTSDIASDGKILYWASMTSIIALVICPDSDATTRPILGLTTGERLLLTLEKGGISQVAFLGGGPRPASDRLGIPTGEATSPPSEEAEFLLVPADLVLDPAVIAAPPEGFPLRRLPAAAWRDVVDNPEKWLAELGSGQAASGRGFAIRAVDLDTRRRAERALMLSLRKDADGIVSRHLNRHISMFFSKRLARFPISPNQITAVVFLVGIISGPFAFAGTRLGFALGGFCYWLSAVLDGCDGEISRLKFKGSPLGAWLDTVVDDLVCLSYIVGMYLGLSRTADHPFWLIIGSVATVFFLLTIGPRYYVMARFGSGDFQKLAKSTRPASRSGLSVFLLAMRDIVFRTDFLPFAGMVTALVGCPEIFAVPFAAGAVASAVDSFLTLAKHRRVRGAGAGEP